MSQKTTHGYKRIKNATRYSCQGLKAAFKTEPAFKEEVFLGGVMMAATLFMDLSSIERILLIGGVVMVWVVELINSAIEAVVDRVGTEHHELAGKAKDMGSAAVMVTMLLCGYIWLDILVI